MNCRYKNILFDYNIQNEFKILSLINHLVITLLLFIKCVDLFQVMIFKIFLLIFKLSYINFQRYYSFTVVYIQMD